MKKFNLDEFIWFIIQVSLILLMSYLKVSGKITYFISGKMMIYFSISMIILIVYTVAQTSKIFTVRSRNYITDKFYPILFVIIICTVFLYVMPNYKSLKAKVNSDDMINKKYENLIEITNDNYKILNNIKEYNDRIIQMVGFIYRDNDERDMILGREVISCCQSDKSLLQVKVNGIDNLNKGAWVKVIGKVKVSDTVYLECIEYEEVDEPIEIYFHEKL